MRDLGGTIRGWVVVALMGSMLGGAAWAQNGSSPGRGSSGAQSGASPGLQPPPPPIGDRIGDVEDQEARSASLREQQDKVRNDERQKKLVADTDKLLALATELKEEVDKTNKDTMSIDVIKKADEIEKLAHSVKEKMKGS